MSPSTIFSKSTPDWFSHSGFISKLWSIPILKSIYLAVVWVELYASTFYYSSWSCSWVWSSFIIISNYVLIFNRWLSSSSLYELPDGVFCLLDALENVDLLLLFTWEYWNGFRLELFDIREDLLDFLESDGTRTLYYLFLFDSWNLMTVYSKLSSSIFWMTLLNSYVNSENWFVMHSTKSGCSSFHCCWNWTWLQKIMIPRTFCYIWFYRRIIGIACFVIEPLDITNILSFVWFNFKNASSLSALSMALNPL